MAIEKVTDHAQRLKDRLPQFLRGAEILDRLFDDIGARFQELETQLFKLLDERHLLVAVGSQLDGIGEILGVDRIVGETDTDYRNRLIGQIAQLAKSGQIEPLIEATVNLVDPTHVKIDEYYPATVQVDIQDDTDPVDSAEDADVIEQLTRVKAAGVELLIQRSRATDPFRMAEHVEVDASGNGPISGVHGFGNAAQTSGGGKLSRSLL